MKLDLPYETTRPNYQDRVNAWVQLCFGAAVAGDKVERNYRFMEEATELVQSTGLSREEAHKIVDYVYDRDIGDPIQEVGGVMNTLATLCTVHEIDMMGAAELEMDRINRPDVLEKVRAKQKKKPRFAPIVAGASAPPVFYA